MTVQLHEDAAAMTRDAIRAKCREVERLLLQKNRAYGNSALSPIGIFARGDAQALIRTRIDDKLNRIRNAGETALGEDAILDLTGYLILLLIARDRELEGK